MKVEHACMYSTRWELYFSPFVLSPIVQHFFWKFQYQKLFKRLRDLAKIGLDCKIACPFLQDGCFLFPCCVFRGHRFGPEEVYDQKSAGLYVQTCRIEVGLSASYGITTASWCIRTVAVVRIPWEVWREHHFCYLWKTLKPESYWWWKKDFNISNARANYREMFDQQWDIYSQAWSVKWWFDLCCKMHCRISSNDFFSW